MATNLGELFYSLRIKDLTQQDIDDINNRLKNLGSNIQIDSQAFKKAAQNAANGAPVNINIGGVSNLQSTLNTAAGSLAGIKIKVDDQELVRTINQVLANNPTLAKAGIGANENHLRQSIRDALRGHEFPVQIKVMKDQARMAIQNALNGAAGVSVADTRKVLNLETANLKSQQAELAKVRAAHIQAADAARTHSRASVNLSDSMKGNIRVAGELGAAMASLYSIHAVKEFLSNIIEIGGELEHQKIALDTIYGDPGKTQTLFSQIKGLARESPFGVMDLTKNIKQLSAYGVAYNEVYDTAKRLADISAATSVDINRLILAFGKTKNRTFLDGLEAKQFAYANIPIYDALSKKLTELEGKFVSVKDVMGRIKKREIGFDMVKEILWDMTDEGGKFYNMQEKLAGSVKTAWKLVRDNIELMFGEIAEGGTGEMLKDLAQTLQGLTREWKTIATVLSTAAVAFGITKLATLSLSRAMETQTATLHSSMIAGKKKVAEELQRASITRTLSDAEKALLTSQTRLTAADLQAALAKGNLTQAQLKQLFVSGKVTKATIEEMVATKALTQAQGKAIIGTTVLGVNLNKLKAGFLGFGQVVANASKALWGFITNPMTLAMAAISAVMVLWQRNNQEMEKAEELGKNLFTKAVEGAKNLEAILKDLKPGDELSDLELTQQIEKLENAIKDYSPDPIKDINETLVTQEGHVNTLVERYEALKQKVGDLKNSFDDIKNNNLSDIVENSIKATNEGWFNDDLRTNLKDYSNALKKQRDEVSNFAIHNKKAMVDIIDRIAEMDNAAAESFKKATESMTKYEQKLLYLAQNYEKYRGLLFGTQFDNLAAGNFGNVESAYNELMSDTDKFVTKFKSDLATSGYDINTETGKRTAEALIKGMIDGLEEGSEEAKILLEKKLEEELNITLREDKITPMMIAKFQRLGENCGDELVTNLMLKYTNSKQEFIKGGGEMGEMTFKGLLDYIKYNGTDNLTKAGWDMLTAMMREGGKAAQQELELSHAEWNNWLKANPLKMIVSLIFAQEESASDLMNMLWNHGDNLSRPELTKIANDWGKNASSVKDVQDNALKNGKDIKERLEAAKKNAHVTQEELDKIQEEWNNAAETYKRLGWGNLEDDLKKGKSGSKGNQKDEVAEEYKQRFKDLKDAWSEYKKWEKSVGDEAAAETVATSGLFADMDLDKIPRTVEQYQKAIEEIESELREAGVKGHTQRESLLNEILKTLLDVKKTIVDEQIQKALDMVDEEIESKLEQYNLYEKVREATGNKELAYQFTFGLEAGAQTDYIQLIKDNFNAQIDAVRDVLDEKLKGELKGHAFELDFEMINRDNVTSLPKELQKAWVEAVKSIKKYQKEQKQFVADLLSQYQNTLEQIEKIQGNTDYTVQQIWNDSNLNDEQKKNLTMKVEVQADYEIFRLSNDYLQFFGGVLAMTREEAENVGAAIRAHLDEQLQKGVITAKEYYDEIEKIEEQLNKIRNVKSKGLTFMTEGITGLNNKKAAENDAKRLQVIQKIKEYEELAAKARERGDTKAAQMNENMAKAAKAELKIYDQIAASIIKNQKVWDTVLTTVNLVSNIVNGISDAFNSIKGMADSLGFDTQSDEWLDMGGIIDTFQAVSDGLSKTVQSIMTGDIGGAISGLATAITTPITIWAQIHDQKLQKDIEESQRQYQRYQNIINLIEGKFAYFLGNRRNLVTEQMISDQNQADFWKNRMNNRWWGWTASRMYGRYINRANAFNEGGALGYERQLMVEQLQELQRQRNDELQKKKTDRSVVDSYDAQIEEMKQAIMDFSKEMAETIYGINLNDWASQIGDALVDAFSRGEDAAEAFQKSVNDIMRNLVSKVITQNILAPAMKDLETWLFGEDGLGGAYGKDFWLDEDNVSQLYSRFESVLDAYEQSYDFIKNIDEMTNHSLSDNNSENTVRAGIQAITEDTADLLASYVNAIRAYCAQNTISLDSLVNDAFPRMTLIAESQLTQLIMIAEYTRRNMVAAETIQQYSKQIYDTLNKATVSQSSGFYIR